MDGRTKAAVLGIAALSVAACGSDPVAAVDDRLPEALFGTWTWIQSSGGIAGTVQTPETEGFTRTLVITVPNQITVLRDGQIQVSTTFEFVPETEAGSAVRSAQLLYAQPLLGFPEQWVLITIEGVLVLTDPCCDGFAYDWRGVQ